MVTRKLMFFKLTESVVEGLKSRFQWQNSLQDGQCTNAHHSQGLLLEGGKSVGAEEEIGWRGMGKRGYARSASKGNTLR